MRGRHAECAYLLDRAIKNPASSEEFARAALDALRLALRPSYAALTCRIGQRTFHCGDSVLAPDLEALHECLARAPRRLLARPRSLLRGEAAATAIRGLDRAMSAAALEIVVPVVDDGTLVGTIAVGPRVDHSAWAADDLELCDRVAARLAVVAARESLAAEVASLRSAASANERLASVGRMAAGLAHEIRNPLVSIRTFTQLLPERHADEEFRSSFLDLTLAEIDRITTLVGELLSYARPAAPSTDEDATADVADCVERTCLLLRSHARGAGVALECDIAELSERAAIDEDKLRQVVINLVVNAIQACDGRGRVRVTAAHADGGRIAIEVRDDGRGMNEDVALRIFEPFFTTRREGTGLGLALVRTLLDQASATIAVDTAPERGTTFRIELLPQSARLLAGAADALDAPAARPRRALDRAERDDEPPLELLLTEPAI